jgi:integrase
MAEDRTTIPLNRVFPGTPQDLIPALRELLEGLEGQNGAAFSKAAAFGILDLRDLVERDYRTEQRRSADRMRTAWRRHLVPYFESMPLSIYPEQIPSYIEARLLAKAARATVQYELALLRRGITLAYRQRLIPERVYVPSIRIGDNARKGFVTEEEFQALYRELPRPTDDMALYAFRTAWRISEIRDLTWDRVDLKALVVRLEAEHTKNGFGRIFPFGQDPEVAAIFERWRRRARARCAHVFHRHGKPVLEVKTAWDSACERAGLAGLRFHDLRRSAVRNMELAGIPRSVAMKISGHKTESIYKRYAVSSEADVAEAVARLAAVRKVP